MTPPLGIWDILGISAPLPARTSILLSLFLLFSPHLFFPVFGRATKCPKWPFEELVELVESVESVESEFT
jgi:hypothetical protein